MITFQNKRPAPARLLKRLQRSNWKKSARNFRQKLRKHHGKLFSKKLMRTES